MIPLSVKRIYTIPVNQKGPLGLYHFPSSGDLTIHRNIDTSYMRYVPCPIIMLANPPDYPFLVLLFTTKIFTEFWLYTYMRWPWMTLTPGSHYKHMCLKIKLFKNIPLIIKSTCTYVITRVYSTKSF